MRSVLLCGWLSVLTLACGGEAGERAGLIGDTVASQPQRAPAAPISIQHERDFELTGDTVPETVRVLATGNSYDSLGVRLEIRSREGSVTYVDRWPSLLYFRYEDRAQLSNAEVLRRVRGHLQQLVRDSSYYDPRTARPRPSIFQMDREQIAYSIAERDWRDRNAVADTAQLIPTAHSEIRADTASSERLDRLVAELARQPAFTYYAGGEANYTIAWSPTERRFFTIWSCC